MLSTRPGTEEALSKYTLNGRKEGEVVWRGRRERMRERMTGREKGKHPASCAPYTNAQDSLTPSNHISCFAPR